MPERKRIFINASTVMISGGLILSQNIINALVKENSYELLITCPRLKLYQIHQGQNSKLKVAPNWMLNKICRLILDYYWLPSLIQKFRPDIILTLCNLPAITSVKQVFLHDNPYITEDKLSEIHLSFYNLLIHKFRRILTYSRMKYVNLIIVQTLYQKEKLESKLKRKIPIEILPPGIPAHLKEEYPGIMKFDFGKDYLKIACFSRYYEHKNIELLYKAASICNKQNLPIKFILTIRGDHGSKSKKLIDVINNNNQNNHILNIGSVKENRITAFMHSIDAFILPSFFETFGMNCIDAWYFRKPFFAADTESLRSSCKEAAIYFDPDSAESVIDSIFTVFNNKHEINRLIKKGGERLSELPNWIEYSAFLKCV